MILGTRISPDMINVEYVGENSKEDFVMNFKILAFQKRMRVGNKVELEFIARGKIDPLYYIVPCVCVRAGYLITDYAQYICFIRSHVAFSIWR